MEENLEKKFEKKSHKKIAITLCVTVLVLALVIVAGVFYLALSRKPEKIFAKSVENVFKPLENDAKQKTAKIDLEFSFELKSNNLEMMMANEMLKSIKLKSITEVDLDKKILNENLKATYAGQDVISADALIQNDKVYFYLNEIYSKFIEVPEDYLEGADVSSVFENDDNAIETAMLDEIKKVVLDKINSKELIKENVEISGEKVQKSTMKLTPKEVLEVMREVLVIIDKNVPSEELKDLIHELQYEIEYTEDNDNYIEISIYTKGLTNKVVKAEIIFVNAEYDELAALMLNKEDDKTVIDVLFNEISADLEDAEEICEITVKKEEDNKGTISLKVSIDEESSVILKLKYSYEYGVTVKERNTTSSITIDNLTEADLQEMYENIENNQILYSLIESFMVTEDDYYEDDYYYDYEDDYYYDYEDDYYYNYN